DSSLQAERDECRGDVGIELTTGTACDLDERVVVPKRGSVGTIRGHRVVRVGDRENACLERDRRPGEALRIAGTVPALVVVEDAADRHAERADRLDDVRTENRVGSNLGELAR